MLGAHVLREVFGPFECLSADTAVVGSVLGVGAQMSLQFVPAGTFPAAYVTGPPQTRPPAQAPSQSCNVKTARRALAARVVVPMRLPMALMLMLFVRRVHQSTVSYLVKAHASDELARVDARMPQAVLG